MGKAFRDEDAVPMAIGLTIMSYPVIVWFIHAIGHTLVESAILAIPVAIVSGITFLPGLMLTTLGAVWVLLFAILWFYTTVVTVF